MRNWFENLTPSNSEVIDTQYPAVTSASPAIINNVRMSNKKSYRPVFRQIWRSAAIFIPNHRSLVLRKRELLQVHVPKSNFTRRDVSSYLILPVSAENGQLFNRQFSPDNNNYSSAFDSYSPPVIISAMSYPDGSGSNVYTRRPSHSGGQVERTAGTPSGALNPEYRMNPVSELIENSHRFLR